MPPDYSDVEYWNARFQTESGPFEWLKSSDSFLPHIKATVENVPKDNRLILHIGPGSSTLSLALRNLVSNPQKVHNVDFSQSAIDLGVSMESKAFPNSDNITMKWTCGDLLDIQTIAALSNDDLFSPQFSLIVDKSATDPVACGPDVFLRPRSFVTPSVVHLNGDGDIQQPDTDSKIHPVVLLTLHLAILAAPDAYWLCLSYSKERFWFLSSHHDSRRQNRMFEPHMYWKLESLQEIPADVVKEVDVVDGTPVHHPKTSYWLYVLRRTHKVLDISVNF